MAETIGIIQEILQDREKGAVRLVSEYRERLYAVAIAHCNDATEAEDLVFRTFEQVLDKVETCGSEASFYSWMCAILRNFHRHSVRRPVNRNTEPVGGQTEIEPLMDPVTADGIAAAIDSNILRQSIEQMSPKMREMLILHYFMDQPVSQIARYLMLPMGTVLSRLHYARRALARRLNAQLKKPAAVLVVLGIAILCATAAVVGAISAGAELETPDASPASFVPSIFSHNKQGAKTMNIKATTAALMTAATTLGAMPANAEPIGSGLAAYLTFDDAVVSNRVPNATITGVTLSESGITSGVKNGEFGHSGFGGYLDINQGWARLDGSQNLTFENGNDFTICIWMRMDDAQTGDPVFVGNGSWSSSTRPGVLLSAAPSSGNWVSAYNYSVGGTSRQRINSGAIRLGSWTFYAISHTSDGKSHYYMSSGNGTLAVVDERDAADLKLLYDAVADRRPFHLGQDGSGSYVSAFEGKIDEFALWTRGLGSTDIEAIYRNGRRGGTLGGMLRPKMSLAAAVGGNVEISFVGSRSDAYGLYVASGGADGGTDCFAWDHFDFVTTVGPTNSSYTFVLPENFKAEGRYYRFFLTNVADCQEVEYVENVGEYDSDSAYFTTPIRPTKDTAVYGEVEFAARGGGTWRNIFGVSDSRYFQFGVHNSAAPYDWYTEIRKLESGGNTFMGAVTVGARYEFEFCATNMAVWSLAASGDVVSKPLLSPNTVFDDMTAPITVFRCTKQTGAIYDRPFTGKIYDFAVLTNGIVACDCVPAKNAYGIIGFYDVVAKSFHPSESSTEFIGGAVTVGRLASQSVTAKAMTASDPVTAYWVGGPDGNIDDPANWHCENSYGTVIEAVPQLLTDISVANAGQMFNAPADSGFVCKSVTIVAPISLSADCDWRGIDFSNVSATGTVDLAGRRLYLSVSATPGDAVAFTDLTGGGELHVDVPAGRTVDNAWMPLSGALALMKDGDGVLVASRKNQVFTGGLRVDGGILRTTEFINTRVLGPSGGKVTVGACGTLRIEDGYTGLEDYDLELAGGTLHMYNGRLLDGRSAIGNLALTADSTIRIESIVANDNYCDAEIAEASVWNLGGKELTVEMLTSQSDFFVGKGKSAKPVFRNGTIILPSQVGYWQDYGSDATDRVCYRYGMFYVRQMEDSTTYDFVNNIPSAGNLSNYGTMSIYGTYTPNSDVCSKLRMMNGAAINLGSRTGAWPMLGGSRPMTFESGATIGIELGDRRLEQGLKIVSWSAIPANVSFVNTSAKNRQRSWSLVVTTDGIYVQKGMAIIIR